MSTMPQNPLFDMVRNWQANVQQTIQGFRTRAETLRQQWYNRLYGPTPTAPAAMLRPLQRLRAARGGKLGGNVARKGTAKSRVIPHVTKPEPYDMTYRGPTGGAEVTHKRLGMEKEPWDFTF